MWRISLFHLVLKANGIPRVSQNVPRVKQELRWATNKQLYIGSYPALSNSLINRGLPWGATICPRRCKKGVFPEVLATQLRVQICCIEIMALTTKHGRFSKHTVCNPALSTGHWKLRSAMLRTHCLMHVRICWRIGWKTACDSCDSFVKVCLFACVMSPVAKIHTVHKSTKPLGRGVPHSIKLLIKGSCHVPKSWSLGGPPPAAGPLICVSWLSYTFHKTGWFLRPLLISCLFSGTSASNMFPNQTETTETIYQYQ